MKENYIKFSRQIIFLITLGISLVAPLFFLPTTQEFFDFNKFTAILTLTLIGYLAWSAKMLLEKKTVITRTPLDIPILVLLVAFFIASITSIDPFISIYGNPARIWPNFATLATLGALYFLVVSNLKTKKEIRTILFFLISGTLIASLVALSSYFGSYLPFEFAQIRSFNPVGIINRLGLLQIAVIPIVALWAVFTSNKFVRTISLVATLTIVFSLILINFPIIYIPLGAGVLIVFVAISKSPLTKPQQSVVITILAFAALIAVIRYVPQVANGTLGAWIINKNASLTQEEQIDTPKEVSVSRRAAWDIAAQAIGKRPIFGTGPGTYPFVYSQLKPRYVNSTDNWALRFNRSSSDFTEFVATIGIVGVLTYLILLVTSLRFIWALIYKSNKSQGYLPLASAIIVLLAASFLTISSFATVTVLFLLLALIAVLANSNNENTVYDVSIELATLKNRFAWFPLGSQSSDLVKKSSNEKGSKSQILPIILLILTIVVTLFTAKYYYFAYKAEYQFRQALLASRSNDGAKTISLIQNALASNPQIDTYHRSLSQFSLNAAINLTSRQELSQEEQRVLSQLVQVAIDQAKVASGYQILPLRLPGISAANVENWEQLSAVYQAFIGAVGGSDVHAVNTLSRAIQLDPENPVLHQNLGILYQRLEKFDLAQRKFEDAIIVKSDFGPAHYRLANLLIDQEGEVARIVNELTLAKRLLSADDPAIGDIDEKLDKYNKELQELQSQNQNSTSEQNDAQDADSIEPSPSPSPNQNSSPSPTF